MNKEIHSNIRFLLDRMESALQRDDFALVLKTSADIFETLAKDIINTPAVQNQTFSQLFKKYEQESKFPKEILDYLLNVYNSRNKTPLAGHGSTQEPKITKDDAIILSILTKAFVNIEYKTRNFNKTTSFMDLENQGGEVFLFNLSFSDNGLEREPDDELKGSLVEATYAAQTGAQIKFDISYIPLDLFEEIISLEEFRGSSLDARITRVNLRKVADHSRELKKIMENALNLISMKSIINQVSHVDELIEIINGIPRELSAKNPSVQRNMWIEVVYDAPRELSDNSRKRSDTWIDVFHKNLELSSSICLDEKQTQDLLQKMNLQNTAQLIGGGWDFFDLTDEIKFQKAIPAILIETVTSEVIKEPNIDINEILHPAYWHIGLS